MPRTTLAHQIKTVYSRLSIHCSSNISLKSAWEATFDTQGSQTRLLVGISGLSDSLDILEQQVTDCPDLDEEAIQTAHEIIAGMRVSLDVNFFSQNSKGFIEHFTKDKLGTLTMLGGYLRSSAPQALIEPEVRSDLSKQIEELLQEIQKAEITPSLKDLLRRHASFMAYALLNMDIIGEQGVYDAMARAMVSAARLPKSEEQAEQTGTNSAASIRIRFMRLCSAVDRAVRSADSAAATITKIADFKDRFSGFLPDS